jgi:hypothetical protein
MERVHQLLVAGNLDTEDDDFWLEHWQYIAVAKVPLETKVAAYHALHHRGIADINHLFYIEDFYMILFADQAFIAALDLDAHTSYRYRACIVLINDDVAAFAESEQEGNQYDPTTGKSYSDIFTFIPYVLMKINAPHCTRFLCRKAAFREELTQWRMTPLMQRLAEELVQPTDLIDREGLLEYGQSVKLIGMCVPDEELVAAWLKRLQTSTWPHRGCTSVIFARKLHTLATPEQSAIIKSEVLHMISYAKAGEGFFELAWLFGLLGSFDPTVQQCFLRGNVSLFPALIFAMIVALCDGYLEVMRGISRSRRHFFTLVARLPMDLQALVSLRLYGRTSTVIQSDLFNRAFLAVI